MYIALKVSKICITGLKMPWMLVDGRQGPEVPTIVLSDNWCYFGDVMHHYLPIEHKKMIVLRYARKSQNNVVRKMSNPTELKDSSSTKITQWKGSNMQNKWSLQKL